MTLLRTLEKLYYKYINSEKVGVKGSLYHRPDLYQSDIELIEMWRAIEQGYNPCANCYGAEREHGDLDDTRGRLDWDKLRD